MANPSRLKSVERGLQSLMVGVLAFSALMLLAGLATFMFVPGHPRVEFLMTVGLIVLMTTPAVRVAIAVLGAIRAQDWLFLTSTVAVTLLLGLTLGLALAGIRG
jgi:hypothetical protein